MSGQRRRSKQWAAGATRRLVAGLAAVSLVLAGIVGLAGPVGAAGYTIVMDNVQFSPSPLNIRLGDTITWLNRDIIPHQVVPDNGGFTKTPILQPGQSYRTKITKVGTVGYHDSLNTFMRGTLIVASAPTAKPTPKPTPKPTAKPTPKPTPKPTATPKATPTVAPSATGTPASAGSSGSPGSSEAVVGGTTGGSGTPGSSGSPGGAGSTTSGGSTEGGLGGLGAILLLVGLVGAAFAGGIWFATSRRDRPPAPLIAEVTATAPRPPIDPLLAASAGSAAARENAASIAAVAADAAAGTGTEGPGVEAAGRTAAEIDEDAPLGSQGDWDSDDEDGRRGSSSR